MIGNTIRPDRIERDIECIAACNDSTPDLGYSRPTFSEAWAAARDYVIEQASLAGAKSRIDAAGNVHIRPDRRTWEEPLWLSGSHLDSVPSGGKFDGVSGVVMPLELLRARIDPPLELVIFAEEEGTTFGMGLLGSRAWVGRVGRDDLARLTNRHGESYLEAGARYGVDPDRLDTERIDASRYRGFLELHPEQGLGLWNDNQAVAAVGTINGRRQYRIEVEGRGNHAGSTRMADRRDPVAAAAHVIAGIEVIGRDLSEGCGHTVMTVGRIAVEPNAINVIASRVGLSVDFRSPDRALLEEGERRLKRLTEEIAVDRGLNISISSEDDQPPEPLDAELVRRLVEAAESLGVRLPTVASGALHDAAIIAPYLPTSMLFIASRDGISHHPDEYSRIEDIATATRIAAATLS